MPVVIQLRVHAKDLDLNPNIWYIQTVHEKQKLPERNVITIRHKKSLTTHWSDLNLEETSEKILEDVNKIISLLTAQGIVVFPLEKITSDLAEMEEHCPRTKKFIEKQMERLTKYGY